MLAWHFCHFSGDPVKYCKETLYFVNFQCVCGGEGIWTTCLPIWITTCIVNQCAKYVSSVKLETNVGQKLLTWYIRLIVIMLYCTTVAFLLSNDNVTVLKACGKHTLTDANYYCKMTSVMVIETRHLSLSS